jgi:hypothetical protein
MSPDPEEAAAAALARAIRRAWPARAIEKAATGWSTLVLVALRSDREGRAAVVKALLDEETLARAIDATGVLDGSEQDAKSLAREILASFAGL